MRPEILIVGAGPSGLILALSLLHHGIPVRIIEGRRHQLWNPAIMPRSLEIFKTLGILDDVLDQATDVPPVRLYDEAEKFVEFEVLPHLEPSPGSPFLNVLLLRPDRLERILHAALARLGCSIGKETELVSFEQSCDYVKVKLVKHGDGEHTPVHEEANYTWVVGTDAAAKIVCDLLGLEFMNETKQGDDVIIGEIYVEGLSEEYWHVWKCSTNHHVGLRRTGTPGLFAYSLAGQNTNPFQLCEDKKRLVQLLHEGTGKDSHLKFGEILSSSFYPSHIRMVNKLMDGRVLIAGVTAGSVRGQGINIDMEDAFNLAWKLALVHKNVAPYSLLNSYSEERLSVIAEMIGQASRMPTDPYRGMESRDFLNSSLFPAGINYRWSSMLLDERRKDTREAAAEDEEYYHDYESDASDVDEEVLDAYDLQEDAMLRAGDRAPDAPCLTDMRDTRRTAPTTKTWHLFDVLGPTHHTVLVFAEATRRWAHVLKSLSSYPRGTVSSVLIIRRGQVISAMEAAHAKFVLEDSGGYAHDAYVLDGRYGVVVIRPDGVIGAIAKGVEGMRWYLQGILLQM